MHRFEDFAPHESFEQFSAIRDCVESSNFRGYAVGPCPGDLLEKRNDIYRIQVAARAEPPSRRDFDLA